MNEQFTNPYQHCARNSIPTVRVDCAINRADYARIKSVLVQPRDLVTAYGRFLKFLADTIEANNYSFTDRDALITVILGSTTCRPNRGHEPSGNDGRTVDRVYENGPLPLRKHDDSKKPRAGKKVIVDGEGAISK